ncbi:MAG: HD-GYP domain-containing protein [Gorillibacterium sp.]|nr:HD-GYP domain-containing protein [Gorillibacterium sp.]
MINVKVSQLKNGSQLSENVLTLRGSLLFEKGREISEQDKVILRAFLIKSVYIEDSNNSERSSTSVVEDSKEVFYGLRSDYAAEIQDMRKFLQKVFVLPASGQPLPILDIRTRLIHLLQMNEQQHPIFGNPLTGSGEDYQYSNAIYVSLNSYQLAKWHGYPEKDWIPVALAGLLHNIGNVKVDPSILNKRDKLTTTERDEMKRHTVFGYQMLKNVPAINEGVKLATLQHHEKEDGSGYPMGIKGDQIHPYAKIIAILEVFYAMTSNSIYKNAESPYLALEQLHQESFGKLDPALVITFIERSTQFYNGTLVKLSDGRIGEIVFTDRNDPTRPWVKVGDLIVNLVLERQLYISEVVSTV